MKTLATIVEAVGLTAASLLTAAAIILTILARTGRGAVL